MLCKVSLQDVPQKPVASKGPMSLHLFRGEQKTSDNRLCLGHL